MSVSVITAALAAAIFLCFLIIRSSKPRLRFPPGPRGIPFIGNAMAVGGRPFYTYAKWQRDHGDIFMVNFGPIRVIVLGSAKLIKECFQNPIFNGRPSEWSALILTNGRNGLLTTEGPVWEEQRRFTSRALRTFGFGKRSMESLVMREVGEFLNWLKSNEGKSVTLRDRFELAVVNALWSIIASKRFQHDDSDKLQLLRNLYKKFGQPTITAVTLLIAPSLLKYAPGLLGYTSSVKLAQDFHAFLQEEIQEHIKSLPEGGEPRDFIDAYLKEIEMTTDESSSFYKKAGMQSLVGIIAEFFFGATETTTLTLRWAMLYLVSNQEVQRKLQREIDSIVGSDNRFVSLADKPRMPYSEATVLETVRHSSIVTTGVMHCTMQDTTFHGYDIPKRTWIMSNMYAIHHQKELWGDPENFRPERFLSPDGLSVVKNPNMVGFSLGKRNCMGEQLAKDEIFLFITNIFRQFNIVPDPSKEPPVLEPMKGFLLKPQDYSVCPTFR